MRKIIVTLLVLSFMLPLWAAVVPTRVFAEEEPTEETAVNFAEGIVWDKKIGEPATAVTENGAAMSNVTNSWDSAGCDILPALKAALGDKDTIRVKLTFELEAQMKAGQGSATVNMRPLLRGSGNFPYRLTMHGTENTPMP